MCKHSIHRIIMPNITLSVSQEMKDRMDTFSEVSWSNVCRNAILNYLDEREKDTRISESQNLKVIGYIDPVQRRRKENKIVYMLKIKNNEPFNIIIDRIIYGIQFKFDERDEITEYPIYFFDMKSTPSNEIAWIGSPDNLSEMSKERIFSNFDEEKEIKWIIYGSIFYRSRTEIYKQGFYIEGILDENSRDFINDQMRV